uniref:Uncharacterized protein LOC102802953 n=1 Tax=Saccoglossus kowalevskii TaxID=10224 RepID=A0ABM0MUX0_SACKO
MNNIGPNHLHTDGVHLNRSYGTQIFINNIKSAVMNQFPLLAHPTKRGTTYQFPLSTRPTRRGTTYQFPLSTRPTRRGVTYQFPLSARPTRRGTTYQFPLSTRPTRRGATYQFPLSTRPTRRGATYQFPLSARPTRRGATYQFPLAARPTRRGATYQFPLSTRPTKRFRNSYRDNHRKYSLVESFNKAIEIDAKNIKYYLQRSATFCALKQYQALQIDDTSSLAYFRKGVALFELKDVKQSLKAFFEGENLSGDHTAKFEKWIDKCKASIMATMNVIEEKAKILKMKGNECFKTKKYTNAIELYEQAVKL